MPASIQGTLLDSRYRVVRHLGSGGMGSVLLCEDERLGRLVAVKRLHADSPGEVEQRFVREAKLGASLNHPNLVAVFDTATDDEGVLIVMEYVEGTPLSRELRGGPLRPESVARMAAQLGSALDHAHSHGVVHRDVKPANVLLRSDGVTKLVDLGIATAADGTRITRSGTVLGTAAYMAPEQLEGDEAGPAADVYSMAAVCFEALSGARPRTGRTPFEIVHSIATQPPPDLREKWPAAPAGAAEVLGRALARRPEERPLSAGALGSALERALTEPRTAPTRRFERPLPAPAAVPTSAPATSPSPARASLPDTIHTSRSRRSRLPALAAVAFLVAFAVAVAFALLSSGGDGDGSDGSRSAQPQGARSQAAKPKSSSKPKAKAKASKPAPEPESAPAPATPSAEAPAEESEQPAPVDEGGTTSGAALNDQGFALMSQGRYDEAIPILQRAVNSFPDGTSDLTYAYALFNLGKSLRLAGRASDAIPILERRLEIPDQTQTVRAELELARNAAARE